MVADEGVRDGANDGARPFTELLVKQILQPDDPGSTVVVGLLAHAMVGDKGYRGALRLEQAEARIQLPVEVVGLGMTGSVRVLDVVRE